MLDGLDTINICVGYKNEKGEAISVPFDSEGWDNIVPVYETMQGLDRNYIWLSVYG